MKKITALFLITCIFIITFSIFSKKPSVANTSAPNMIYLHEQKKVSRSSRAHLNSFSQQGNVILIFYADWCGPCTRMAPLIEKSALKRSNVTFIKINIDYFEALRNEFAIQSVPTLIFMFNGTEISRYDGKPLSQEELNQLINKVYARTA